MLNRPSFHTIMMHMAQEIAQRSTCERGQVGTVITSADFRRVLALGYNGNATGLPNGCDRTGEAAVGNCGCLHSEDNATINCDSSRQEPKIVFVTLLPCVMCAKRLINLGNVGQVFYLNDYRIRDSLALLRGRGIRVARYVFPTEDSFETFLDEPAHNEPTGVDEIKEVSA